MTGTPVVVYFPVEICPDPSLPTEAAGGGVQAGKTI